MNFKYPFFLIAIGVLVAGVTPFAMSQVGGVEPSMEIDMIAGQTQPPFRIQDENNVNEFAIRTDGTFSAGTWNTWKYESDLNVAITRTDCGYQDYGYPNILNQTSPCVIAQLDITQLGDVAETGGADWWSVNGALVLQSLIKKDAGTGTCNLKLISNDIVDDTFFRDNVSGGNIATATTSYSAQNQSMYGSFSSDSDDNISSYRLVIDTGSAGTTCSFKNIGLIMELPDWHFLQYDIVKDIKS